LVGGERKARDLMTKKKRLFRRPLKRRREL